MRVRQRLHNLSVRSRAVTKAEVDRANEYLRRICRATWEAILYNTEWPLESDTFHLHRRTLEQWCRQRARPLDEALNQLIDEALLTFPHEQIEQIAKVMESRRTTGESDDDASRTSAVGMESA